MGRDRGWSLEVLKAAAVYEASALKCTHST